MSDEKKYKCPNCSKKFSSKLSLNQHVKAKHKNFQCKFCNKKFGSENALAQHILNGKCNFQKNEKNIECNYCNRKFKTDNALKQHVSAKHEKEFVCSVCGKGFTKEQSLTQHIRAKHQTDHLKNNNKNIEIERSSKFKSELGVYEHLSLTEKIRIFLKGIFNEKKTILMDECVGNDITVINALKNRYNVIPIPNNLLSHKDNDLRLIIKEKNWGLVSKDFEMVVKSSEAKIKPVYFLKEVRGNRALIKISKRNYNLT